MESGEGWGIVNRGNRAFLLIMIVSCGLLTVTCVIGTFDNSQGSVLATHEALPQKPHQKARVSHCIVCRSYVFLPPGLVASRQGIIHSVKGHSFKVLIFKAVVSRKGETQFTVVRLPGASCHRVPLLRSLDGSLLTENTIQI